MPISAPSLVTTQLSERLDALNGATLRPVLARYLQIPADTVVFPAFDDVPHSISAIHSTPAILLNRSMSMFFLNPSDMASMLSSRLSL